MRLISISILILFIQFKIHGQVLEGRIIDSKTYEPLEYVSIGIINTTHGTITDNMGYFKFEAKGQDLLSVVRISMIGYEPQKFTVGELENNNNEIKLVETTIELAEVIIKPTTKERKLGATGFNRFSGWSGWGGLHVRKGYEMGTKIDLGNQPVKIKNLYVLLHRQAFDTSFYRLHIRSIRDTLILDELLTENIIISITKESGWVLIDLEPYNLVLSGDVGLTLEWLKVKGLNKDRAMKINDKMQGAYILFKNKKNHYGIYRWGTEAKWIINKKKSPSMYLTIKE
ncbi:MAG: carboxypeptidase-like regulatory domain-containing protein [Bacteroidales bacterium]|nr:carboxypeptidase-like regulatory domain-containing protein [Bacteroidales bacterium]